MALSPGARIGSYVVVGPLGAGGMGEVYRARDERLGRDAAIKILPEAFLGDADRVARFEREARTLASLNHPNIAGIYGIEGNAIVMELVEGEDLSERIARGAMPIEDALHIGRQIASALEAAHEQGIVHRDLKPANVKVRPDGAVKVLDFGLARPGGANDAQGSIANSPTMTSPATAFGMIMGTAAYMSPEQARGKVVDKRADVWAFGVVLYEMISGRRAYPGSEVSDVLASVLKDALPLDELPAGTPAPIRRLLRRCLQKDRADRLDSLAVARLEIADALSPGKEETSAPVTGRGRPGTARGLAMSLAAILAASALTGYTVWRAREPEAPKPASLVLSQPLGEPVRINVNQPSIAISHDGRRIAYAYGDPNRTIVTRVLDQFVETPLTDLGELPRSPFFSPDDAWIGYFSGASNGSGGRLMKVAVSGGSPLEIGLTGGNLRGASWGQDNTIVFATSNTESGLFSIRAAGGQREVLTTPDAAAGEVDHLWPTLMPDGKHVVFTVTRTPSNLTLRTQLQRDIAVLDLATRKWNVIREGGSFPRFVVTGHLLFVTDRGLHAAPFDPETCRFTGDAVRVVEDVAYKAATGAADFDVSDTGALAFIAGRSANFRTLNWVDSSGVVTPIPVPPRLYQGFLLSPDRTRAVTTVTDDAIGSLLVLDLSRGSLTRITPPSHDSFNPVWSSDGRYIYYRGNWEGRSGIYRLPSSGGGTPELVLESKSGDLLRPTSTTPDGRSLITSVGAEIEILGLEGPPAPRRLVADPDQSQGGVVSPDGRWLAYQVRSGVTPDVFLRPFPDVSGDRVQVSVGGGATPAWSKDSRSIYYLGDSRTAIWRVDLGPKGQLGKPVLIHRNDDTSDQVIVATGENRIIRIQPDADVGKGNELRLVLNWFEMLKQKMAGK